jgi:hypothetical protein
VSTAKSLALLIQRTLLACYPAAFRDEFAAEMRAVFEASLTEAQHSGRAQMWQLIWRELRDWPGSVLQAHLNERMRKMASTSRNPMSRGELLAAFAVFLLPLLSILAQFGSGLGAWFNVFTLFIFFGIFLFTLGLAAVRQFPRWSLAHLGFALHLGLVLGQYYRLWIWTFPLFLDIFGPRGGWSLSLRILYAGTHEIILWLTTFLSALILVNLLRLIPATRSIWQSIRTDWTRLSYLLYGMLVFYISLMTFDEYHYDGTWKLAAWSLLALGAWLYLRSASKKRRILALLAGSTTAMWTVILAKWVLIPLQAWPVGYPVSPSEITRGTEVGYTFISWIGFTLVMLMPAFLDLLPPAPEPVKTLEEDPIQLLDVIS